MTTSQAFYEHSDFDERECCFSSFRWWIIATESPVSGQVP
jgi:hypothetical protein